MADTVFRPENAKRYSDRCVVCGGPVIEERVTLVYPDREGGQRVIHNVPAGVCQQCGEKYLHANVAIEIERILSEPPERLEEIGASDFATAV